MLYKPNPDHAPSNITPGSTCGTAILSEKEKSLRNASEYYRIRTLVKED